MSTRRHRTLPLVAVLAAAPLLSTGLSAAQEATGSMAPIEGLQGPYLDQRQAAVKAIAQLPSEQQQQRIPELVALVDDDNWQTQLHAARALGAMGDDALEARPALIERLSGAMDRQDGAMVRLMAKTLINIKGQDPKEQRGMLRLLSTAMRSGDDSLTDQLISLLTATGAEAVPQLTQLLQHEEETLRKQAVSTLRGLGEVAEPAVPDLIALAEADEELRRDIERALREVKADNEAPSVTVESATCLEGESVVIQCTVMDPDNLSWNLAATVVDQPSHGSVERVSDTSFRYQSKPGHIGEDSFTVAGKDRKDTGSPATVTVSITKDKTAPQVVQVVGAGKDQVRISFDEPVAAAEATDPGNYRLGSQAVTGAELSEDGTSVTLQLGSELSDGEAYEVTVGVITDRSAQQNSRESITRSFQFHSAAPGLSYQLFTDIDNGEMEKLSPQSSGGQQGTCPNFDIDVMDQRKNYGVVFDGLIQITQGGSYTFETESDDGSFLYINGEQLVDNGGFHGMETESGTIDLQPGRHAIAVVFFQGGGGQGLEVRWSGPGIDEQIIPAKVLSHRP